LQYRNLLKNRLLYPLSFDGTESFNLFDHIQAVPCDGSDTYRELKVTTSFFNIVVSHRDFKKFQQRAIESMLDVLKQTDNWKAISTIPYTLDIIKDKVTLTQKQTNKIVSAVKTNMSLINKLAQKARLCSFLQEKYQITID